MNGERELGIPIKPWKFDDATRPRACGEAAAILIRGLGASQKMPCSSAIVIDAGSTGSRGYAYFQSQDKAIQVKIGKKIKPGLAQLIGDLDAATQHVMLLVKTTAALIAPQASALRGRGSAGGACAAV